MRVEKIIALPHGNRRANEAPQQLHGDLVAASPQTVAQAEKAAAEGASLMGELRFRLDTEMQSNIQLQQQIKDIRIAQQRERKRAANAAIAGQSSTTQEESAFLPKKATRADAFSQIRDQIQESTR